MASAIADIQSESHRRLILLSTHHLHAATAQPMHSMHASNGAPAPAGSWEALLGLSAEQAYTRRREWNREPLIDLFPRIPAAALESILDICIAKNFTYNLSEGRLWNARRYTAITVAHVRHRYSEYDSLLKNGVERFEARRQSGPKVWKVLRDWCPWDSSNEVLERCFQATLLPLEQRAAEYMFVDDPMDIDTESDYGGDPSHEKVAARVSQRVDLSDDPMDID